MRSFSILSSISTTLDIYPGVETIFPSFVSLPFFTIRFLFFVLYPICILPVLFSWSGHAAVRVQLSPVSHQPHIVAHFLSSA